MNYIDICQLTDILPGTGVCAHVEGEQIAIFRPDDSAQIFALSNIDPFAQASVLSRGLIVEHQGDLWVASPLKKQRFRLRDGYCLEQSDLSIKAYQVTVSNNMITVAIPGK